MEDSEIRQYILSLIIMVTGIGFVGVGIDMLYRQIEMPVHDISVPAGLVLLILGFALIALARSNQTRGRRNSRQFSHILLDIVFPIVIIFLLAGAAVYLFSKSKATADVVTTYEALRDILQIVLAIIAVGIAALGYATYLIVRQRLQTHMEKEIGAERRRTTAKLFLYMGLLRWRDFENTEPEESRYREDAIELTEAAHKFASELDERDPKNEHIIAMVRNNLAWYLASRRDSNDRIKARGYATYIHARSRDFPEDGEAWEATYRQVMSAYP